MILALLLSLSSGQFFSQACKQNSSCILNDLTVNGSFSARDAGFANMSASTINATQVNTNQIYTVDAGTFLGGLYLPGKTVFQFPTCNSSSEGFLNYDTSLGGLTICDSVFHETVASYASGIPIAFFTSRTIASGVITTGNNLLGATRVQYAPSLAGGLNYGEISIRDRITCQCATAGTGAGNIVFAFRKISGTGAPVDVCTKTIACTSLTLSNTDTTTCTGTISDYNISDIYTNTIDVSGCTTPPADCSCSNLIETQ